MRDFSRVEGCVHTLHITPSEVTVLVQKFEREVKPHLYTWY